MSATITITLEVSVTTQKNDKVAVTGAQDVLGAWDPTKVRFLKPKKSLAENGIWFTKINLPLSCESIDYRYLVCRKVNSAHGDDAYDETHIIRHWESGVHSRHKTIKELGSSPSPDVYGSFEPDRKMFIDQGWLIDETEIQLRFYKDPIHMYRKSDQADIFNVKCSSINLFHDGYGRADSCCSDNLKASHSEELFDRMVHASNPLIRVSSLGHYRNKEQSLHGMPVSSSDYVTYKLRIYELDSHAIKVDFYTTADDENDVPKFLGFTNILPQHLEKGAGSLMLSINSNNGSCLGYVTVRYLVCTPLKNLHFTLEKSFTQFWNRHRPTLEIGHRGLGDTHHSEFNTETRGERSIQHENTIASLITAGYAGADFVEFDVMLSKDKVPVIWHDFKVSILLRKKARGQHKVYHLPVHELNMSHLKDLRVDFVRDNAEIDHNDPVETMEPSTYGDKKSPFPTLKEALDVVDDCVGFYVELKYPQYRYGSQVKEGDIESYFDRNTFLDPILKVLHENAGKRRIVLASFDPDICIMARIKQNRYPVIMLIEEAESTPYYSDIRAQKAAMAISLAKSEKFLGLSINAGALLRNDKLLDRIFSERLICFVWGEEANDSDVRDKLKSQHVHAICHDEIGSDRCSKSILRAEHEDKLCAMVNDYRPYTPMPSPAGSDEDQDPPETQDASVGTHSSSHLQFLFHGSNHRIPNVQVTPVHSSSTLGSNLKRGSSDIANSAADNRNDYTDFY